MELIGKIIAVIVIAFTLAIILALPVMLLWNFLMPDLFGLKEIGLWKSFCLILLCGFLFKGSSSSSDKK